MVCVASQTIKLDTSVWWWWNNYTVGCHSTISTL